MVWLATKANENVLGPYSQETSIYLFVPGQGTIALLKDSSNPALLPCGWAPSSDTLCLSPTALSSNPPCLR